MASISTDFVRRLGSSKFNYWFGYVANLSLVAWLLSHAFGRDGVLLSWAAFAAYATTGVVLWTLAEYLLHRYVYHVWPSALSVGHDLHHKDPKALIGVPWWFTSVVVIGVYEGLATLFNPAVTGIVLGTTWLGYIAYCVMHHGSHHWSMRSAYFRHMKRAHLVHHAYPAYNWGFTTNFWDVVFRTHFPADRAAQMRARGRAPASTERTAA